MHATVDLKHIEQKSWRSNFQDGITELSLGLMFLAFAFAQIFEQLGLTSPWNILVLALPALAISILGKRMITQPRVGRVKFGPRRKTARKRMLVLSITSTVFLVTLVTLTALGIFPGRIAAALPGFGFMAVVALGTIAFMALFAFLLDYPRLALLGVIVGLSVVAAELLRDLVGRPWHFLIAYGTAGVIMLAMGALLLISFMRTYPPLVSEAPDAG
ncbi:hypothetical protein ACFL5M_06100 [Candidatus Neomarinimicrobiota bacterium]